MRFIGDIHGKIDEYFFKATGSEESVQVGDFGFGWFNEVKERKIESFFGTKLLGNHKFIRGNHDNPNLVKESKGFISDGTYDSDKDIFYVGGAWSIDWASRNPGVSWWFDEELSDEEFEEAHNNYVRHKPKIMVTHDGPNSALLKAFSFPNFFGDFRSTRTGEKLNEMFYAHKPKVWIFGHWHEHVDFNLDGTRFICLSELQHCDLNLETLEITY